MCVDIYDLLETNPLQEAQKAPTLGGLPFPFSPNHSKSTANGSNAKKTADNSAKGKVLGLHLIYTKLTVHQIHHPPRILVLRMLRLLHGPLPQIRMQITKLPSLHYPD
jgi:hypothetical protein